MFPVRLHRVRECLASVDALTISSPIDLFYLTGIPLSAGRVVVTRDSCLLGVDGRYFEQCLALTDTCQLILCERGSPGPLLAHPTVSRCRQLGFDAYSESFSSVEALGTIWRKVAKGDLVPLERPLSCLRMIKDREEIELLAAAAHLAGQGFDFLMTQIREGVTEEELARKVQIFWLERGGDSASFEPIIAFGEHSTMPHWKPTAAPLAHGACILIDIGVRKQRYHSDMTRLLFFGKRDEQLALVHQAVQAAHEAVIARAKPGVPVALIDKTARDVLAKKGLETYFTHSLGHGVGLEVHEDPFLRSTTPHDVVLQEGMVITIEPGVYLPHVGGVRLEDTYVVKQDGLFSLTQRPFSFPVI